jgi:hypothetical protein
MKVPKICPRCKDNWVPNNEHPGQYPGAISRVDNVTEICSPCGVDEAMIDYATNPFKEDDWESQ